MWRSKPIVDHRLETTLLLLIFQKSPHVLEVCHAPIIESLGLELRGHWWLQETIEVGRLASIETSLIDKTVISTIQMSNCSGNGHKMLIIKCWPMSSLEKGADHRISCVQVPVRIQSVPENVARFCLSVFVHWFPGWRSIKCGVGLFQDFRNDATPYLHGSLDRWVSLYSITSRLPYVN